jgi:hypothetical protein
MIKKSQEEDIAEYLRFLWQEQIAMSGQVNPSGTNLYISNPTISRSPGMPYLMIRPFGWEQLDGDTIRFLWDNIPEAHYTLLFFEKPKGGKPVAEFSLTDTMFQLPAHTPWFSREVTYYWSVFPQGKPNATRFPFRMMNQKTYQQLDQELSALIAGSNPGSALTWITRASFYDSHKMYSRAQKCYLAAIHAEPENNLFGDLYELFLLRMATPSDVTIYY